MRTASAPEAPPPKPAAAQTSGLDWSGSIEAGPTLIRSQEDPNRVGHSMPAVQMQSKCFALHREKTVDCDIT